MHTDPLYLLSAQYFLAVLFLVSSLHKALNWPAFVGTITSYQITPAATVKPAAFIVLLIELILATLLMFGFTNLWAGTLAMGVFGLYFSAMAINLFRGRTTIHCGCSLFNREAPLSHWHLLRNSALIGLSFTLCLPQTQRAISGFDIAQIGLAVACLGILYLAVDSLLANRVYLQD